MKERTSNEWKILQAFVSFGWVILLMGDRIYHVTSYSLANTHTVSHNFKVRDISDIMAESNRFVTNVNANQVASEGEIAAMFGRVLEMPQMSLTVHQDIKFMVLERGH